MEGAGLAPSLQSLSDAARRRPQRALVHDAVTPACAQPEVNFVILVPPGMSQGKGTLRREAMPAIRSDVGGGKWPAWSKLSPCSYRYEVRGTTFANPSPRAPDSHLCILIRDSGRSKMGAARRRGPCASSNVCPNFPAWCP